MKKNETQDAVLSKRFLIITVSFIAVCILIIALTKVRSCNAYVEPVPIVTNSIGEVAIPESEKININTATVDELVTLSGIGKTTAESIIEYRNNNNGFLDIEEIMKVKGIGESKFEAIKDYITVG